MSAAKKSLASEMGAIAGAMAQAAAEKRVYEAANPAKVRVTARMNERDIASLSTRMTTDLPTEKLGEAVSAVVQMCWQEGHDPVNFHLIVHFE